MFKKAGSIILRVFVSLVLLFLFFKFNSIDLGSLLNKIKGADKAILGLAFSICFLSYLLCFYRWKILLKAIDIKLPSKRLVSSFSGGVFFSLFLPSTIGGDFARSIDLSKHTKKPKEVVATVLLDRISGYVGMAIVTVFSIILGWGLIKDDAAVLISAGIIILILAVVLLSLFNNLVFSWVNKLLSSFKIGNLGETLSDLHEELYIFKQHKKAIFVSIIISLFNQAISPLAFYATALALHIDKPLIYYFIFLPIIGAITLLPISTGGFGVREHASVVFFARAGIDEMSAGSISLLNSFFLLAYGLIGGLIYVLAVYNRRMQSRQ